jgi:hypothetical protein
MQFMTIRAMATSQRGGQRLRSSCGKWKRQDHREKGCHHGDLHRFGQGSENLAGDRKIRWNKALQKPDQVCGMIQFGAGFLAVCPHGSHHPVEVTSFSGSRARTVHRSG